MARRRPGRGAIGSERRLSTRGCRASHLCGMVDGMRSRRGRLVWALAGVLALVGCAPSEGAEGPTAPVAEPSQSTEPVTDGDAEGGVEDPSEEPPEPPEVDPPERPVAMEEETVEGAIAAAKYFMELYPYIYATGDLEEWDALSDDGCEFCRNSRELAFDLTADGGFSSGGAVEIFAGDGGGPYEGGVYAIVLGVRFAESTFVYA